MSNEREVRNYHKNKVAVRVVGYFGSRAFMLTVYLTDRKGSCLGSRVGG